jgi:predicted Zn-dependent peptidase
MTFGIPFRTAPPHPQRMYRVTRLPNGLTVATAEMPHLASVSLGWWVAVGGRFEPAALNGASHFIEHMLFKGTRRRDAGEISQAVEGIGGQLNAFTTEEYTCFYAKATHDHLPALLDVIADMFFNSTFDPGELRKERDVIKEELASYLDQPHQHVQELLSETLFPNHPLGRSLTGNEKALDRLGRRELLAFRRANYVAPATLITVAGRCRHERVLRAVRPLAARLLPGKRPAYQPFCGTQERPRIRLHTRETAQLQLALAFRVCSRHDPRRYPLRVLNAILGENMSSRLFQVLREDRGLAYSIHSGVVYFDDVGTFTISAGLDTPQLRPALKLIRAELRRLRAHAPSVAELRRACDYVIGQFELGLEGSENQMTWIGEQLLGHGRIVPAAEIKRLMRAVTPAAITAVAREYFRPDRASLAIVSPLKSARGLEALLCP